MRKLIVLETSIREEDQCTYKQYEFIRDLMIRTHEELWLNKLAYNTRNILNKSNASKLISALINKEEFELKS